MDKFWKGFLETSFNSVNYIKKILKNGSEGIFSWIIWWILQDTTSWANTRWSLKVYSHTIERLLYNWSLIKPFYKIQDIIERVSWDVVEILDKGEIFHKNLLVDIRWLVEYRLLLFWILQLLKDSGFKKENLEWSDRNVNRIIFNILQDPALSSFLIILKGFGIIDLNNESLDVDEVEDEVKIENIDREETVKKLIEMWAVCTFDGEIEDIKYDYPETIESLTHRAGSKVTFRIRKKIPKKWKEEFYYTIKRSLTEEEEIQLIEEWKLEPIERIETKRRFEKQLWILSQVHKVKTAIGKFWLIEVGRKKKKRIRYELDWVKFDFDLQEGVPEFMEIESTKYSSIVKYIGKLWLQDYEMSSEWGTEFADRVRRKKWN